MNAVADTGSPIQPSSISFRHVWSPAPRNVSGAAPSNTPFSRAKATMRLPSSRVTASGFSV